MSRTPKQSHFVAIILAIIAGGIIPASFGLLTKIYETKAKQPVAVHNLRSAASIYSELYDLKKEVLADHISLLRAHDSGGPIPNKSSIVAEVLGDDIDQIFNDWQSQPLDMDYLKLLEQVVDSKKITLITDELEESILKDAHASRGIIQSDMRYLGANQDSIYYLIISFKDHRLIDSSYLDNVRSSCEKVRAILQEAKAVK
jgi:hypothetical protein